MSQRQPSELKSTVRSLASKEEAPSGGMSLASKKVPDIAADTVAVTQVAKAAEDATTDTEEEDAVAVVADASASDNDMDAASEKSRS